MSHNWLCSKAKLCYDRRSVGQSVLEWNTHLGGLRPDLYYCQTIAALLMWGAVCDERTGLSFARFTVSSIKSVVSMYNLDFTCYLMYVYTTYTRPLSVQTQYSRSCPNISSSCYNGSLVIWTVVKVRVKVKVKVKVTLWLAVYCQSVCLGVRPFQTHAKRFFFPPNWTLAVLVLM
jgi:hypothetical protein